MCPETLRSLPYDPWTSLTVFRGEKECGPEKKGWFGYSPFIYRYSTPSVTTATNTDPRSAQSGEAVMGHYTDCSWHWSHDRGTLWTHSKLSVFLLMLNWAQISGIPRESCAHRFNRSQARAEQFPFINRRSSTQGPRFLQRSIFLFRRWDSICTCWCVVETGRRKCVCVSETPPGAQRYRVFVWIRFAYLVSTPFAITCERVQRENLTNKCPGHISPQ